MDDQKQKVHSLSNKIRENPTQTDEEQDRLIRYLQSDDPDLTGFTAMRISSLSEDYPEQICDRSDKLAEMFISLEDPSVRFELAKSFKNLAESGNCINKHVIEGLTEATRIRDEKYWETEARKEESTIKHAIKGWLSVLNESDRDIPKEVVESIAGGIPVFHRRTVIRSIQLFKTVCTSGGEGEDLAFQTLKQMANADNTNVSLRAMSALAELSLDGAVEENKVVEIVDSTYRNKDVPEDESIEELLRKHSEK